MLFEIITTKNLPVSKYLQLDTAEQSVQWLIVRFYYVQRTNLKFLDFAGYKMGALTPAFGRFAKSTVLWCRVSLYVKRSCRKYIEN